MSVVVVAVLTPRPGRIREVLDAFAVVSPKVHEEPGCELYALHHDDEKVFMVERWSSREELDAHSAGRPLAELNTLLGDTLAAPPDVSVLENVPLGNPVKGTIQ
jgi:quinol monooxygenase YgiN